MKKLFFTSIFLIYLFSAFAQNNPNVAGILFYNVENLFDTINNQMTQDDEFTPGSSKQWTSERYMQKLKNLGKVINSASPELPAIIGLCEVENKDVVKDLIEKSDIVKGGYGIIHFDSPDERGIDVALLYRKSMFNPENYFTIPVRLPQNNGGATRDILFVEGKFKNSGVPLFIFVNHWPSRAEGEELTQIRRSIAAQTLKKNVDSLNAKYIDPAIIIMGDFNDTPFDKSIQQDLGAKELNSDYTDECLVNLSSEKQKNNEGSYQWNGKWQALDQFIVSEVLLNDNSKVEVKNNSLRYIKNDWMLYNSAKYGVSPSKTYSGDMYYGGYSDHLPVYMELVIQ